MKGDTIAVVVSDGSQSHRFEVTASKGGRTVRQGTKGAWTTVEERTAPSTQNRDGRPTGNTLKVRTASVLAIHETRLEPKQLTLEDV